MFIGRVSLTRHGLVSLIYVNMLLCQMFAKVSGNNNTMTVRTKRQYDFAPEFFAPDGTNDDDEPFAPLIMELMHNLTIKNGPNGRHGICWRNYRVLNGLKHRPSVECHRYSKSRQAALGDLTEFYHTLLDSRRQKNTFTVLLSDKFPGFSLSASFMHSVVASSAPLLMIEASSKADQALCVESIRCKEQVVLPMTTSTPVTEPQTAVHLNIQPSHLQSLTSEKGVLKGSNNHPPNFWQAIMANSSPRSWVVGTLVLTGLSFILLLISIGCCIWACHLKRQFRQKRCRGTCRFGCKCSPDAIRQAAVDAAICGPLGLNSDALQNGSIIGYQNSNRSWGLPINGKSPLYVSLAPNEKFLTNQAPGTPPQQTIIFPGSAAGSSIGKSQNWPHYQMSMQKAKRLSQEATWRSHSDGSSLSEHTLPSAVGSGPAAFRNQPPRSTCQQTGYAYSNNLPNATTNSCLHSYCQAEGDTNQTVNTSMRLPSSPSKFEDFKRDQLSMATSIMREGNSHIGQPCNYEHNGISSQPVVMTGLNGKVFDQTHGSSFIQQNEPANITPPAAFFDVNGSEISQNLGNTNCFSNLKEESNSSQKTKNSEQAWSFTDGLKNNPRTSFNMHNKANFTTPNNHLNHPAGAIKVLPTSSIFANKQNFSSDFKRKNMFINGENTDETSSRRTTSINPRLIAHTLTEGIEPNYAENENKCVPFRAWSETVAP